MTGHPSSTINDQNYIDDLLRDDASSRSHDTAGVTLAFQIKRFALHIMLDKAIAVISTRDAMPVLTNFQFEVTPDRLRVVATDMERSLIATTRMVTVTTPGIAVFPARRLLDIIRRAEEDSVTITVAACTAHIASGPTVWNLQLLSGHDYPELPDITEATHTCVDRAAFAAGLATVRYAASRAAERISLMMVNVAAGKMTACDGSRIQQATFGDPLPFDFRIPIAAVDHLLKLLKTVEVDTIRVGESVSQLIFGIGEDTFLARKLVEDFPNMERILLRPALENTQQLRVGRDALLTAVRRVRITADTNTSAIALHLSTDRLTVVSRDAHKNNATESIPADWNGVDRTLAVNHGFLSDMVTAYAPPECLFLLGDDTPSRKSPILLKDPDAGTLGVVQQMNIDWVGA